MKDLIILGAGGMGRQCFIKFVRCIKIRMSELQ